MSITPGRTTSVIIDVPAWGLTSHPTNASYAMGLIAADNLKESDNIEFIEGVGYQLAAIQRSQSFKHETSAADNGVYRPGSPGVATGAQFAPQMLAAYRYRADTDLTGNPLISGIGQIVEHFMGGDSKKQEAVSRERQTKAIVENTREMQRNRYSIGGARNVVLSPIRDDELSRNIATPSRS